MQIILSSGLSLNPKPTILVVLLGHSSVVLQKISLRVTIVVCLLFISFYQRIVHCCCCLNPPVSNYDVVIKYLTGRFTGHISIIYLVWTVLNIRNLTSYPRIFSAHFWSSKRADLIISWKGFFFKFCSFDFPWRAQNNLTAHFLINSFFYWIVKIFYDKLSSYFWRGSFETTLLFIDSLN